MSLSFIYLKRACFLFNFIVLIVGPTLLAISLRLLLKSKFSHVFYFFQDGNSHVTHILVAVGALMTIVGIFGCIGVLTENSCLLWIFPISMISFIAAEIACGAYIYNHQDEFSKNIEKSFSEVVENYGKEPSLTEKMDIIQSEWNCCGAASYKSWADSDFGKQGKHSDSSFGVPKSCCINQSSTKCVNAFQGIILENGDDQAKIFHEEGCSKMLGNAMADYAKYALVTISVVAAIQILAAILTMLMVITIRKRRLETAALIPRYNNRPTKGQYLFPAYQEYLKTINSGNSTAPIKSPRKGPRSIYRHK